MNLDQILTIFSNLGCNKIYTKRLRENDNSKNGIYLGTDLLALTFFPTWDFTFKSGKDGIITHSKLNFYWISPTDLGKYSPAPDAKMVFYPRYPEYRFSGFINKSAYAPSELSSDRITGRMAFFGVTGEQKDQADTRKIYAYVAEPSSPVINEYEDKYRSVFKIGIFDEISITKGHIIKNTREEVLKRILAIHKKGWLDSEQLKKDGTLRICKGNTCGGLTLEAALGISKNSKSAPDLLGWELKQHSHSSRAITLIAPEPDGGVYKISGISKFLTDYGWPGVKDVSQKVFNGVHRYSKISKKSKLTLIVEGFDIKTKLITSTSGCIKLVDNTGDIASLWTFQKLMESWNKKHEKAVYIKSQHSTTDNKYKYSNLVNIGTGTKFEYFLISIMDDLIFYDPGIRIKTDLAGVEDSKGRSQFRSSPKNILHLYDKWEAEFDLNTL